MSVNIEKLNAKNGDLLDKNLFNKIDSNNENINNILNEYETYFSDMFSSNEIKEYLSK